jgi:Leishmanolysin.
MTGTHTQNPVYSRLTLALMEDTGWYSANYSMAQPLAWGRNLGCEFVTRSCKHWMDSKRARYENISGDTVRFNHVTKDLTRSQ